MEIKELFISVGAKTKDAHVFLEGGSFTLVDMKIAPVDFLMQAEADFIPNTATSDANCLSNAKRAITGQMDQILCSVGYEPYRWNVPQKVSKIRELGVLTPSAIRKLVKARNLLEHEYASPSRESLEDFLDLAALFVLGIAARFHPFSDNLAINYIASGIVTSRIVFGIHPELNPISYRAYGYEIIDHKEVLLGEADFTAEHPLFSAVMRACSSLELKYKVTESLSALEIEINRVIETPNP